MGEVELSMLLCAFLAGSADEQRQHFDVGGMRRHVRVDCETDSHVIEVGLDAKSSARDSLHQALFAAHLTGKTPLVVIVDRDGYEGRFEHELRRTTEMAGVAYARCAEGFIQRWAATQAMRRPAGDDLPAGDTARAHCDLGPVLRASRQPAG